MNRLLLLLLFMPFISLNSFRPVVSAIHRRKAHGIVYLDQIHASTTIPQLCLLLLLLLLLLFSTDRAVLIAIPR